MQTVKDYTDVLLLLNLKNKYNEKNLCKQIPVYLNNLRNENNGWDKRERVTVIYDNEAKQLKTLKFASKQACKYQITADHAKLFFGIDSSGYAYYKKDNKENKASLTLPLYFDNEEEKKVEFITGDDAYGDKEVYYLIGAAKTLDDYFNNYHSIAKNNKSITFDNLLKSIIRIMVFRYVIGCMGDTRAYNILIVNGKLLSINELGVEMKTTSTNEVTNGSLIMNQLANEMMKRSKLSDYIDYTTVSDVLTHYEHIFVGCKQRLEIIKNMFLH